MPYLDPGTYKIECVKPGGLTLENYGQFHFEEGQVTDLLDPALPTGIKCSDWETAYIMCHDGGLEIAQKINLGHLEVVEVRAPSIVY
jgi:hypothetical protein